MKAQRIEETFENPFRMVGHKNKPYIYLKPNLNFIAVLKAFILSWLQYLPSADIHVNQNAKFDPSSKMFEVSQSCTSGLHHPSLRSNAHCWAVTHLQISKKWKLLSVEKQQQELEAKRKAKQEAKEQAKKATGNGSDSDLLKKQMMWFFIRF